MIKVPAQITNPVGLDAIVQNMQNWISQELSWLQLSFGKAYRNQDSEGNFYPEVYVGNNEYLNVFAADTTDSMSFFDVDETTNYESQGIYDKKETEIKIIFFVNLKRAKNKDHRADSEVIDDIETVLNDHSSKLGKWQINSFQTGIENVYNNYDYNGTVNVNYEPYYILTFNMSVSYRKATYC